MVSLEAMYPQVNMHNLHFAGVPLLIVYGLGPSLDELKLA